MRFVKMQGTGNDFLLVEAKDEERDWGALEEAVRLVESELGLRRAVAHGR